MTTVANERRPHLRLILDSRRTSHGDLSPRSPTNSGCRSRPSRVHSTNDTGIRQFRRHGLPLQQPAFQALRRLRRPCGHVWLRIIHPAGRVSPLASFIAFGAGGGLLRPIEIPPASRNSSAKTRLHAVVRQFQADRELTVHPLAPDLWRFLVVIAWRNCQRADRLPKLECSSVADHRGVPHARPRCDRIGRCPRRSVLPELSRVVTGAPGPTERKVPRRPVLALRSLWVCLGDTRRRRPPNPRPTTLGEIRMTRAPFVTPRCRYDDSDLVERMEAAMARTRRLIDCSRAIRASVESQDETPFTPRCANCRQAGRMHESPPSSEHHYICAQCHKRWVVDGVLP